MSQFKPIEVGEILVTEELYNLLNPIFQRYILWLIENGEEGEEEWEKNQTSMLKNS